MMLFKQTYGLILYYHQFQAVDRSVIMPFKQFRDLLISEFVLCCDQFQAVRSGMVLFEQTYGLVLCFDQFQAVRSVMTLFKQTYGLLGSEFVNCLE